MAGCSLGNAYYQGDEMSANTFFGGNYSDNSVADRMGGISVSRNNRTEATTLQGMFMDSRPIGNNLMEQRRSNARYVPPDTLPPLQADYKEPMLPDRSRQQNPPPPLREPRNDFERAFRVQSNTDTPASLGIAPQQTRNTGPILRIDALPSTLFKPAKEQVTQAELRTRPFPNHIPFQSVAGNQYCRALQTSKLYSANGALDTYNPWLFNQKDGYSSGAVLQPRGGGYHPRARFYVPQEYKQANIMYGRPGNPAAINTKLPVLMHHRAGRNMMSRGEYERIPFPYNKGRQGFGLRPDCVEMKPVCRGFKYEWAGQAFSNAQTKDELRLKDYNIRPKNLIEFSRTGARFRNRAPIATSMNMTEYNTERGNPCRTVKELGPGRAGGPILGLDGIGDALHTKRMTDAVMRACPNKGTGALSMDRRAPVATRTDAPQYQQDFPGSSINRVSPEILMDIDPTLITAYKTNPYAQQITN